MDLIKRLNNSYNTSVQSDGKDNMWTDWIVPKLKNTLNGNLKRSGGSTPEVPLNLLQFNLENPSKNYLCFGFDDMHQDSSIKNYNDVLIYNNTIRECLLRLCASVGITRFNNPEGGELPQTQTDNIETLLLKLDTYFGFTIDFPNIFDTSPEFNWLFYINYHSDLVDAGIITEIDATNHYNNYGKNENRLINGEIGLPSSRGIIKLRSVHSLHFISRIKELSKKYQISSILEIGGGMGRNAYYAKKLGIKKYIIVDIPSTCLMSGYYLGRTLGEVTLNNETTDNYAHIVNTVDDHKVDLIFQSDGLTEMGLENSKKYLDFGKIAPLFLSINHEANKYTVRDLYTEMGIPCIYRNISWYRDGYIEELLKLS